MNEHVQGKHPYDRGFGQWPYQYKFGRLGFDGEFWRGLKRRVHDIVCSSKKPKQQPRNPLNAVIADLASEKSHSKGSR